MCKGCSDPFSWIGFGADTDLSKWIIYNHAHHTENLVVLPALTTMTFTISPFPKHDSYDRCRFC